MISVWRFDDAPLEYQELSPHGGDEDWVAFIPEDEIMPYLSWAESGTPFGYCDVSIHRVDNGEVRIGAHA